MKWFALEIRFSRYLMQLLNILHILRKASSGMLRRVALVRTDVSEERSATFIRGTSIRELGKTRDVTSNRRTLASAASSPTVVTLMKEALSSSETSVIIRATWRNIPEGAILHSHRRENLKSYILRISLSHTYTRTRTHTHTLVSTVAYLRFVACYRIPMADVPLPTGSLSAPYLSHNYSQLILLH
jgi:hypothetical protein